MHFWTPNSILPMNTSILVLGFLDTQLEKNPLAMQETLAGFLGQEDPLERDRLPTPVFLGFPDGSVSKESACNAGGLGLIPGLGRSLEKGKATHTSTFVWRISWTEEAGGLQFMQSPKVRHN